MLGWTRDVCALGARLALLLAAQNTAQAQTAPDLREAPADAVTHFELAREHYRLGRYREAVAELDWALMLDPNSPTLLYNLGRVHELSGNVDDAIRYFTRYLEALPEAEAAERSRTQETLLRLEGARHELTRTTPTPTPARSPEPLEAEAETAPRFEQQRWIADGWFWALAGTSAASAITAAVTGWLAYDRQLILKEFVLGRDGGSADRDRMADEANRLALGSDIALGVSIASALGAAALFTLRERTVERFGTAMRERWEIRATETAGAELVWEATF